MLKALATVRVGDIDKRSSLLRDCDYHRVKTGCNVNVKIFKIQKTLGLKNCLVFAEFQNGNF